LSEGRDKRSPAGAGRSEPKAGAETNFYMKKKILIPIFVVLFLAVAAGGFFWWWQGREIKGSPGDYVIKETEEGKIVENKRAGLTVKVPEGWMTQRIEFLEGSVVSNTSDIEGRWEDEMIKPPLKKGCGIETAVVYKEMNFDGLKEEIKEIHAGLGILSEEMETITINNQQAFKNTFDSKSLGPGMAIYFLGKNKTYSFALYWASDDKERCIEEFDKFLETVSIK